MSWLSIVILSYFILAFVNLIDKFLLDQVLGDSKVYAFIISLLGSVVLLAAPWLLLWPGWGGAAFQLGVGAIFPLALFLMFQGLKHGDASKVTVLIGGMIPIFTIILSLIFFDERLTVNQWIAVFYLLLGTFIIAQVSSDGREKKRNIAEDKKAAFYYSLAAAFVYAIFFIGTKQAYSSYNFYSSFIWIRIGSLFGALLMLVRAQDRREIFTSLKSSRPSGSPKNRFIVIGNQTLGALSFLLQNYAISLGSVAIVNALQGVQYVFILIMGWLFTIFKPKVISENISRAVLVPKIIAVLLVAFGLYFLII